MDVARVRGEARGRGRRLTDGRWIRRGGGGVAVPWYVSDSALDVFEGGDYGAHIALARREADRRGKVFFLRFISHKNTKKIRIMH